MLVNNHPSKDVWEPQKIDQMIITIKWVEARIGLLENKIEKFISINTSKKK